MATALKIKKYIENDIWKITFYLDASSLPESDKALIQKFGEPEINIGGIYTITVGQSDTYTYTLPDKFLRVRTDLPYTQEFDAKSPDFEDYTELKANAFLTQFKALYSEAFSALRANADTFTGEEIYNIY